VQSTADRLGITWPGAQQSVTALPGDTSLPRLGLSQHTFEDLAASVQGIYHCAAPVSWVKSYAALEPAVVGGAREMLRLAVLGGVKPLHYVSSLAVFPFDGMAKREDHQSLDHGLSLLGGYAQAKWVAERLMTHAATLGLPVTIYRPPLISGHSKTGVFNADSYFERMIKGCIELGEAPQLDGVVDVAPVDYVAAAFVYLASQPSSAGQVYHLNNPHPMAFGAFVDWIRGQGYPLTSVPFARWQQNLLRRNTVRDNALDPLTTHLKHTSSATMTTAVHDCRNAAMALSPSGLRCPALGAELLTVYFQAFENSGFLDPLVEIGSSRRLA
jgi:thioester reductase-like protein